MLNKYGDNIQTWGTPFPILNQSITHCLAIIVASWPANRFLRRHVRCSSIPISFKNCPQFVVIHTVKGFRVVKKAEGDIFLECLVLLSWVTTRLQGSPTSFSTYSPRVGLTVWSLTLSLCSVPVKISLLACHSLSYLAKHKLGVLKHYGNYVVANETHWKISSISFLPVFFLYQPKLPFKLSNLLLMEKSGSEKLFKLFKCPC